jgi:hypothetical protein
MAGNVVNMMVSIPLKLRIGLTGKCHAICHYSYNLPLAFSGENQKQYETVTKTDKLKGILTIKKGGQKCDTKS